ncbi:MAG: GNAT family N-acetyltransferase [Pleurocapsa sp. MO_226.B13]|nr:GNAT family N-acetyltransferase [Pleurocapsa sp. MO_226.B13]
MQSITIKRITIDNPLYQAERELRNQILLRPIGIPNYSWEMYDRKSWHFVALNRDRLMGCVVLVPLDEINQKAQLIQMAVDESMQGRGIGTLLVQELLKFAKAQGLTEVTCHARQEAVAFYRKFQFEVYDKPFEEVGLMHRHMKIEITNSH